MRNVYPVFRALALALLFCTALSCDLSAAEERAVAKPYIFYTGLVSPINDIIDARLQEAFRRLGLKVKLHVTSSSQRALILANEEGDGDAARILNIEEYAPQNTGNLIRVPESKDYLLYGRDQRVPVFAQRVRTGVVLRT